jgi:hypothetical protein
MFFGIALRVGDDAELCIGAGLQVVCGTRVQGHPFRQCEANLPIVRRVGLRSFGAFEVVGGGKPHAHGCPVCGFRCRGFGFQLHGGRECRGQQRCFAEAPANPAGGFRGGQALLVFGGFDGDGKDQLRRAQAGHHHEPLGHGFTGEHKHLFKQLCALQARLTRGAQRGDRVLVVVTTPGGLFAVPAEGALQVDWHGAFDPQLGRQAGFGCQVEHGRALNERM